VGRHNIYIRDEDEPVWEQVGTLAGDDSMSQIIVRALKNYIRTRQGLAHEWLTFFILDEEGHESQKKFSGRWLVDSRTSEHDAVVQHPRRPTETTDEPADLTRWSVAETAKGQVLVWAQDDGFSFRRTTYWVFKDLDDAEEHGVPADVLSKAASALGLDRAEVLDV
jgi:hypothetical protein